MSIKFLSFQANRAFYDVAVIFNQQPTTYYFNRENPQLKHLERVEWRNIPLFNVQVDSKGKVSITIETRRLTQPYINRLKRQVPTSFVRKLYVTDQIIHDKNKIVFSSPEFRRSIKMLIAFVDSSREPIHHWKTLLNSEISMTILLRICAELLNKNINGVIVPELNESN